MKKRAQITLFVIVGLLLITLVYFFLYSINYQKFKSDIVRSTKLPPDVEGIRQNVELCFKESGENALVLIGLQGGYAVSPIKSYEINNLYVPFYYFEGSNLMPSLKDIESEISDYVSNAMQKCVDINEIKGFDARLEKTSISSNIGDNKVIISANYPLTLIKGNVTFKLIQPYEVEYDIRLKKIYLNSLNITNSNMKGDYIIDFDSLRDDMNMTVSLVADKVILYTQHDDKFLLNNKPYVFVFAAKFK